MAHCPGCLGNGLCWICGGEGCARCTTGVCHLCSGSAQHRPVDVPPQRPAEDAVLR